MEEEKNVIRIYPQKNHSLKCKYMYDNIEIILYIAVLSVCFFCLGGFLFSFGFGFFFLALERRAESDVPIHSGVIIISGLIKPFYFFFFSSPLPSQKVYILIYSVYDLDMPMSMFSIFMMDLCYISVVSLYSIYPRCCA